MLGSLVLRIDDLGTMMPMECFSRDPSAPLLASRSLRKRDPHGSQGYYPDRMAVMHFFLAWLRGNCMLSLNASRSAVPNVESGDSAAT